MQTIRHLATHVSGTANLLELASILVRGQDAGVTPAQFRAMYPSLSRVPDTEIAGFATFAGRAFRGEVHADTPRQQSSGAPMKAT